MCFLNIRYYTGKDSQGRVCPHFALTRTICIHNNPKICQDEETQTDFNLIKVKKDICWSCHKREQHERIQSLGYEIREEIKRRKMVAVKWQQRAMQTRLLAELDRRAEERARVLEDIEGVKTVGELMAVAERCARELDATIDRFITQEEYAARMIEDVNGTKSKGYEGSNETRLLWTSISGNQKDRPLIRLSIPSKNGCENAKNGRIQETAHNTARVDEKRGNSKRLIEVLEEETSPAKRMKSTIREALLTSGNESRRQRNRTDNF